MSRKSVTKRIITEGKFIRLFEMEGWEFVERNNCTGIVVIIAMTDDKKVILTQQHRLPVGRDVIEFPAGLVNDKGHQKKESLALAAKRELLEETGYAARKMIKIISGPVSGGFCGDLLTMFRAEGLVKKGKGGGDETEAITTHAVPLKEVDDWLKSMEQRGCLVDPKVYSGLYFLKRK